MVTYPLWMSLVPFGVLLLFIIGANIVYAFTRQHKKRAAPVQRRLAAARQLEPELMADAVCWQPAAQTVYTGNVKR